MIYNKSAPCVQHKIAKNPSHLLETTGRCGSDGRCWSCPHGQEQLDNARRCVTLTVGCMPAVKNYTVDRVTEEISDFLASNEYRDRLRKSAGP
jgi:hypothetical protein